MDCKLGLHVAGCSKCRLRVCRMSEVCMIVSLLGAAVVDVSVSSATSISLSKNPGKPSELDRCILELCIKACIPIRRTVLGNLSSISRTINQIGSSLLLQPHRHDLACAIVQ